MVREVRGRVWAIAILALAVGVLVFFVAEVAMSELREEEMNKYVVVRDAFESGAHHISGALMIPSLCDLLTVRTEEKSPTQFHLSFETWREPYRDCPKGAVSRWFRTVIFTSSENVTFTGDLNGEPFPLIAIPAVDLTERLGKGRVEIYAE